MKKKITIILCSVLLLFIFTTLTCYIISNNTQNYDLEKLYTTQSFDNHHFANSLSDPSLTVLKKYNYNFVMIPVAKAAFMHLEEDIFIDCIQIDKPKEINISFKDYKTIVQAEKHNWNYYYCLYDNTYTSLNVVLKKFCLYSAIIDIKIDNKEIKMIYFENDKDVEVPINENYETIQIEDGDKIKYFQIDKTDYDGIVTIKEKFFEMC